MSESRGVLALNIRYPSLIHNNCYKTGVGFGVEASNQQYLVTAGHTVKLASERHVQIGMVNRWFDTILTPLPVAPMVDLAVYRIDSDFGIQNTQLDHLSLNGIFRGAPVDIVWPAESSVSSQASGGIFLGQCPLITRLYNWKSELFFLGAARPGRSGAPICYRTKDKPNTIQIAAVLTAGIKLPYLKDTESNEIVCGTDIQYAVEAIQNDVSRLP